MTDSSNPARRGQLRAPISVGCCRWTPIIFAELDAGKAASIPDAGQNREMPSDAAPAAADKDLLEAR